MQLGQPAEVGFTAKSTGLFQETCPMPNSAIKRPWVSHSASFQKVGWTKWSLRLLPTLSFMVLILFLTYNTQEPQLASQPPATFPRLWPQQSSSDASQSHCIGCSFNPVTKLSSRPQAPPCCPIRTASSSQEGPSVLSEGTVARKEGKKCYCFPSHQSPPVL